MWHFLLNYHRPVVIVTGRELCQTLCSAVPLLLLPAESGCMTQAWLPWVGGWMTGLLVVISELPYGKTVILWLTSQNDRRHVVGRPGARSTAARGGNSAALAAS
jgi:hypothetical protein